MLAELPVKSGIRSYGGLLRNDIYTDIMGTFYSLKARDDGGIIGVCFGYVGTFQLLSCHNYFSLLFNPQ